MISKASFSKGFTLTEVLIVVVMIAIMASLALPRFINQGPKAGAAEAINTIGAIKSAEYRYLDEKSEFSIVSGSLAACDSSSVAKMATLGLDLSNSCAGRATYHLSSHGGGDLQIEARFGVSTSDTLFLRTYGTGTPDCWGGTGIYQTRTGASWPNLNPACS